MIAKLVVFLWLCSFACCASFAEMFDLGDLLLELGKLDVKNNNEAAYIIEPTIFNFLGNFPTRTDFCHYKCPQFYNVGCFLLFGCNIHLRNFFFIVLMPVFALISIGLCCGKGTWTFHCWGRYLAIFTGVVLIIWFIRMRAQRNKPEYPPG